MAAIEVEKSTHFHMISEDSENLGNALNAYQQLIFELTGSTKKQT